ncbi:MAG: LysM peptidoglycan-binding domain-containing protein [Acidimicrobiales bacterium]
MSRLVLTVAVSAAPFALPAVANGADSDVYIVESGDTLSDIAAQFGVRLADLLEVNDLTVTSLILPGQRLTIPGTAGSASSPAVQGGESYTVRPGDSLSAIAGRYEVPLASLLQINGLTVDSLITPGMQLTLPAGAKVSRVERVVNYALAQVGKPYRFFTKGPDTFDCSGLTLTAYAQIGIPLVHYSGSQARQGTAVDFWSEPIRAGDLVFMATNGSEVINHVGIAVNSTTWVQARESKGDVRIGSLPPDSMIVAVRRFVIAD